MKTNENKFAALTFPLLLFITMLASFLIVNFIAPGQVKKQMIDGDGSGYYAYLPTLVILKTVDFTPVFEIEKQKRSKDYQGHYFNKSENILVNKYTSGTALMQLPFFLIAYLLSFIFGLTPDGFNIFFQYGIAISAIFYVFLGLLFFKKLADLFRISSNVSISIAFACLFGTNLFFYTFLAPAMSHAYSFSLIAIFLYYLKRAFIKYNSKYVFVSAFLLGLIVLIRPVNFLVILAIPFIGSSNKALLETIRRKVISKDVFISAALFLIAISPQLIINSLQTGKPFIYGYEDEGFYWQNPEALKFLFSYRKGWFVYTPLMLLIIPAIFHLFKRSKYEFVTFIFFLAAIIYFFSAWWNWLYGNSLGMRPMVDFYSIFLLVIGLFLNRVKTSWLRVVIAIFIFLSVFLNLFQTWQYERGILHYDSMNRRAYWYIFLKTADKYIGAISDQEEYYYGKLADVPFIGTVYNVGEDIPVGWTNFKDFISTDPERPKIALDENVIYSPTYAYWIHDSLIGMQNLYIDFSANYAEEDKNAALGALFVVDISDETGKLLFYKTFRLKRLPDDVIREWREGSIGFKLPEITQKMHHIKLYVWNDGKQTIYLDRMAIKFLTYDH